ncbi:MAG: 50S ribosomal protein L30 [Holosporaceae bacterium]|jgi:large subunit ribosomal protein L30|nr:50S ribosomal protein L30 [Holosporaceae bacterium]
MKEANPKGTICIRQVGSCARCEKSQVVSLRALGLGRIGKKVVLQDNACVRGLVKKVSHLVSIGDANE